MRWKPFGRAHHQEAVDDGQIAPFDQLDAHLLSQKRVLEVRRIINARRQQRDFRAADGVGREIMQRVEQLARIRFDRPHMRLLENLRERALHHFAVFEHVRHARRAAQIVFEDVKLAVAVAHQIGAGDVAPDAARRIQANARRPERFRRRDDMLGNDAFFKNPLLVVNVVDEEIQRGDALLQSALDPVPFLGFDDTWKEIKRKDFLGAFAVAVDIKSDPHAHERIFSRLLAPNNLCHRQSRKLLYQQIRTGPRARTRLKSLVKKTFTVVFCEIHANTPGPASFTAILSSASLLSSKFRAQSHSREQVAPSTCALSFPKLHILWSIGCP